MNDAELDEILNQWKTPPVPPSLRGRIRAKAFPKREYRAFGAGRRLIAATVLAAAIFFFIVAQASPRPAAPVPWSVDSEFLRYADDGSSSVEMYTTSYQSNTSEVLLSRSIPGNPLQTLLGRTLDASLPTLAGFHMHILGLIHPEMVETMNRMKRSRPPGTSFISACTPDSGCLMLGHYGFTKSAAGCADAPIVDRATILNHPTEAARQRWTVHGRMTVWMAPDLACFALKVTYEEELPAGTFHLVAAKQALKVTINP